MTDLEVFQLSAKAIGYDPDPQQIVFNPQGLWSWNLDKREYFWWNPFTDASQRWECVKKLLEGHESWMYLESLGLHSYNFLDSKDGDEIKIACSADEFPARALAELESRKVEK